MAVPELNIPSSSSTVRVSVIDTGTRVDGVTLPTFLEPIVGGLEKLDNLPALSFLIENETKGQKYIFDLSIRKDWREKVAPTVTASIEKIGWTARVSQNVGDVLKHNGVDLASINGVIWSHWHWDHTGAPEEFPASTDLVVGPGFKENYVPNWPTVAEGPVNEEAWANRTLRELNFDEESQGLVIGDFKAIDWFGDGTFYLLDAPGHTIGHLCALARTTPNTFIFMGGDACHHAGAIRPSEYVPLPENITPNPLQPAEAFPCPGGLFMEIHPQKNGREPFYTVPHHPDGTVNNNRAETVVTKDKVTKFDASDDVLVMIAHDPTLLGLVPTYPQPANDWQARDLKHLTRWRFLGYWKDAIS